MIYKLCCCSKTLFGYLNWICKNKKSKDSFSLFLQMTQDLVLCYLGKYLPAVSIVPPWLLVFLPYWLYLNLTSWTCHNMTYRLLPRCEETDYLILKITLRPQYGEIFVTDTSGFLKRPNYILLLRTVRSFLRTHRG